jgi:hypothetical protein
MINGCGAGKPQNKCRNTEKQLLAPFTYASIQFTEFSEKRFFIKKRRINFTFTNEGDNTISGSSRSP